MRIKKAVILAAGFGTRMLPQTKAVPKELLPIVDKPSIQYLVEEAADSGITDILIVISRGKSIIEDHFDRSPELESHLQAKANESLLQQIKAVSSVANIYFIRQTVMNGTAVALKSAQEFTGGEPFAVMYGDDIIFNPHGKPALAQLIDSYDRYGKGVAGVQLVSENDIHKYSSMKVKHISGHDFELSDMIEKPSKEQVFSLYSILGRLILPPCIYTYIDNTPLGVNDEFQITDAMKALARKEGMIACEFEGKRYDMGSKMGFMQAQVETALRHPLIGRDFKNYLTELVKDMN